MRLLIAFILLLLTLPSRAIDPDFLAMLDTEEAGGVTNVTAGLVGWWKFDDGSGSTAVDSSASGNNGVLHNTPTWISGQVSGGITYDGVNQYMTNAQTSLPTGTTTFSAWLNPSAVDSQQTIVHHFVSGSTTTSFTVGQWDTGSGRFGVNVNNTGHWQNVALAQGAWTHVVVVISADSVDAVYTNGVAHSNLYGETGFTVAIAPPSGNSTTLARRGLSNTAYWAGSMDDVRYYNRALDAGEAAMLYNWSGEP